MATSATRSEPTRDRDEIGKLQHLAALIAGGASGDDRPALWQTHSEQPEKTADERRR